MKKYEVRVDYGQVVKSFRYYFDVKAENEDMARDKAACLLEYDVEDIDWYDTTIVSEKEI